MPRINLITILMLLIPVIMPAQSVRTLTGTVYASAVDSLEQLPNANISLMNADSTFVKSCVAGNNGEFKIQYTPTKGKNYILRVTYTGMNPYFRNLPDTVSNFNLGRIVLESKHLGEVVISAPMKIIDTKGDTTIINAEAFRLREGATLEELVKRVPGLTYDAKTKIMKYNGNTLSGIYVNGKPFFSGKNDVAMENLPAEVVEKMKIYDKRSEEEEFLGKKLSNNKNYVLDLKTKRQFNGTLIGSAAIGAGNYHKKQLDADANYFKSNGDNMSLVFRSGNKDISSPDKDNRTDMAHLNLSKDIGKKIRIFGNMSYNYMNRTGDQSQSYSEQYMVTGNRYLHSDNNSLNKSNGISGRLNASWRHNKTLVLINASLNNSDSKGSSNGHQASFTSPTGLPLRNPFNNEEFNLLPDSIRLNESFSNSLNKRENSHYHVSASITQRLNNKGTSINLNVSYTSSNNTGDNFSVSSTRYYKLQNYLGNDSILYRNQYNHSPINNHNIRAKLQFSQSIGRNFNLHLSYSIENSNQKNNRNTFDLSPFSTGDNQSLFFTLPEGYETQFVDSLSNRSMKRNNTNSVGIKLDYRNMKYNASLEFSANPLREKLYQKTGLHEADTVRNSVNYNASLNIYYYLDKTNISLSYTGNTVQPMLSDLLTLTDNSNPLYISHGNPNLKPSYSQNIFLTFSNTDIGLNGNATFSNTYNSVTQAITYDPITGGQETCPVNINGNCDASASIDYHKNFKSRFDISVNAGYKYFRYVSLVNERREETPDKSVTRANATNVSAKASYNPSWGGINLNTNWNFSQDVNSLREITTYSRNYTVGLDVFGELPGNIQLRSNVAYTYRSGSYMTADLNKQAIWNIAASWRFLKKRQAELSVEWHDILNDTKNYTRNVTADALMERYTPQIGSYFIVSFKYRFNQVNKRSDRFNRMSQDMYRGAIHTRATH